MNDFSKKEIYFTKDVFKDVSEKLNVNPKVIEGAFSSFVDFLKKNIENTDNILYPLPYLGEMMITHGDALREMEKYHKRSQRERNREEKKRLSQVAYNYRVRAKKIRIEVAKIQRSKLRMSWGSKRKLFTRKYGLTKPENIKSKDKLMHYKLEEVIQKQNDYAYKHYKEKNLPVTL